MKLPANTRMMVETIAKEAALRHFKHHNPNATDDDAWRFALRAWRSPEFIQVGAETVATLVEMDEAAAAALSN